MRCRAPLNTLLHLSLLGVSSHGQRIDRKAFLLHAGAAPGYEQIRPAGSLGEKHGGAGETPRSSADPGPSPAVLFSCSSPAVPARGRVSSVGVAQGPPFLHYHYVLEGSRKDVQHLKLMFNLLPSSFLARL